MVRGPGHGELWDPLATQGEYDLLCSRDESWTETVVRRNRMGVFNAWVRRQGVGGPEEVTDEIWETFCWWLTEQSTYADIYCGHVMRETRKWLQWAIDQDLRTHPINPYAKIIDPEMLRLACRVHKARQITRKRLNDPHNYHLRELGLALVFAEGWLPEDAQKIEFLSYSPQDCTLLGKQMDARLNLVLVRYAGVRTRFGRPGPLFCQRNGKPLAPGLLRRTLNHWFEEIQPERCGPRWRPDSTRDREDVLDILAERPQPVPRVDGGGKPMNALLLRMVK